MKIIGFIVFLAALTYGGFFMRKRKQKMADYGLRYQDDRGVQQDFLGRKSFLFATVVIAAGNLNGRMRCPIPGAKVTVMKSTDVDFWINTSTFKKFSVWVEGDTVVWDCQLIRGATLASPVVTLLCLAEA